MKEAKATSSSVDSGICIANMSGSGRLELVMLNLNHVKICVA